MYLCICFACSVHWTSSYSVKIDAGLYSSTKRWNRGKSGLSHLASRVKQQLQFIYVLPWFLLPCVVDFSKLGFNISTNLKDFFRYFPNFLYSNPQLSFKFLIFCFWKFCPSIMKCLIQTLNLIFRFINIFRFTLEILIYFV